MRVLIVDDEAPARAKLRRLIGAHSDLEIVAEAENGRAAIQAVQQQSPDVMFLDVQMPGMDGFEVIAKLEPSRLPYVVFVTAHLEHAVRAFEVRALDYLLKPVAPRRFAAVVLRLREETSAGPPDAEILARLQDLLLEVRPVSHLRHVLIHTKNKAVLVPAERIDWIDADGNYVRLHIGSDVLAQRATLSALGGRLDPSKFLRINRSQIVRLDAIRELHPWSHGDYHVVLKDGTTLTWSRRFRAAAGDAFSL